MNLFATLVFKTAKITDQSRNLLTVPTFMKSPTTQSIECSIQVSSSSEIPTLTRNLPIDRHPVVVSQKRLGKTLCHTITAQLQISTFTQPAPQHQLKSSRVLGSNYPFPQFIGMPSVKYLDAKPFAHESLSPSTVRIVGRLKQRRFSSVGS